MAVDTWTTTYENECMLARLGQGDRGVRALLENGPADFDPCCRVSGQDGLSGMRFFPTSTRFRVRRGAVIAVLLVLVFAVTASLAIQAYTNARHHRAQTTLTGDLTDQEELQGILNLLSSLGITVVEVVTIPED